MVRGMCTLNPAACATPQRLRVRSLVGRYLEHSRIFRFGAEATPTTSSAPRTSCLATSTGAWRLRCRSTRHGSAHPPRRDPRSLAGRRHPRLGVRRPGVAAGPDDSRASTLRPPCRRARPGAIGAVADSTAGCGSVCRWTCRFPDCSPAPGATSSTPSTRSTRALFDTGDRRLAAAGGELSLNRREGWRWRRDTLGHPKLTHAPVDGPGRRAADAAAGVDACLPPRPGPGRPSPCDRAQPAAPGRV